jgi:hypothetical protein
MSDREPVSDRLKGKIAIVAGARRGCGRGVALALDSTLSSAPSGAATSVSSIQSGNSHSGTCLDCGPGGRVADVTAGLRIDCGEQRTHDRTRQAQRQPPMGSIRVPPALARSPEYTGRAIVHWNMDLPISAAATSTILPDNRTGVIPRCFAHPCIRWEAPQSSGKIQAALLSKKSEKYAVRSFLRRRRTRPERLRLRILATARGSRRFPYHQVTGERNPDPPSFIPSDDNFSVTKFFEKILFRICDLQERPAVSRNRWCIHEA